MAFLEYYVLYEYAIKYYGLIESIGVSLYMQVIRCLYIDGEYQ